jgi:hypothetical protein
LGERSEANAIGSVLSGQLSISISVSSLFSIQHRRYDMIATNKRVTYISSHFYDPACFDVMMQDEQGGGSKDKTVWAHSVLSQWSERLDPRSPMNARYSHKYLRLDSQWQIFKFTVM